MTAAADVADVRIPVAERGPAPRQVIVGYGFWLFLLSDIIVFSAFFAAYAVLADRTAGGPSGAQLFHRGHVLLETACLLLSSFACAMMALAGILGIVAACGWRAWRMDTEREVTPEELAGARA